MQAQSSTINAMQAGSSSAKPRDSASILLPVSASSTLLQRIRDWARQSASDSRCRFLTSPSGRATRCVTPCGKHLLGLINTVLDISKVESGQFNLNLGEYSLDSMV